MHEVLNQIQDLGIVPVVKIDDPAMAVPLAQALKDGGLPCAEITFRTDSAKEAMKLIGGEVPDLLLGAGTVLTTAQVDSAVECGARFVMSPGFNPSIVEYCIERGIPVVPGCSTPSDMEKAIEAGLEVVKFFPAEESGGLAYIRAVSAPYTMLRFIPTGGINAANLNSYLSFNRVLACGGSWMVKAELIDEGCFEEIKRLTKEAVNTMLGFRLLHLGINASGEDEALKAAEIWQRIFNFPASPGSSPAFTGPWLEYAKSPCSGEYGRIIMGTLDIRRAAAYLKRSGFDFRTETAKTNDAGETTAIYLSTEIAGFSICFVKARE